jgi:hypothetical protein
MRRQYCGCDITLRSHTGRVAQAFTLRSDQVAHCCGEITIAPDSSDPWCPGRKHGTVIVKNFHMAFPPRFYTDMNVEADGELLKELQYMHEGYQSTDEHQGQESTLLKSVAKTVAYSSIIRLPRWVVSKESISKKISTGPRSRSLMWVK